MKILLSLTILMFRGHLCLPMPIIFEGNEQDMEIRKNTNPSRIIKWLFLCTLYENLIINVEINEHLIKVEA